MLLIDEPAVFNRGDRVMLLAKGEDRRDGPRRGDIGIAEESVEYRFVGVRFDCLPDMIVPVERSAIVKWPFFWE